MDPDPTLRKQPDPAQIQVKTDPTDITIAVFIPLLYKTFCFDNIKKKWNRFLIEG